MHGQYIRNIDRLLISEEDTFLWLLKGNLLAETESEIVATQDQALETKYYATKILNTETDSKCRPCQHFYETIDHIISGYPILAKEQYIKRHDRVCAQLHFNICKETGVKLDKKPDIIIRDNEKGTCMLIDVAISGDRNVIKMEAEKILKYKDLTIEIQRMWNVRTKVIPVIIRATGTISK